jgi:hypothetical protein
MCNPVRQPQRTFFVVILALFLVVGCSSVGKSGSSSSSEEADTQPTSLYRDFKDILVPGELKVDDKRTYIIQGPGLTTGIMTLKGYVERDSLIDFFKSGMVRDNWTELASFKSPSKNTSSILVFQKADRTAIINIQERSFSTTVEIAVAPMEAGASSGLMKAP